MTLEELQDWREGIEAAASGQPCDLFRSLAYQDGHHFFHNNDVAKEMARRLETLSKTASRDKVTLITFQMALRSIVEHSSDQWTKEIAANVLAACDVKV